METTLLILKPDAIRRNLQSQIIGYFIRQGFKVERRTSLRASLEQAQAHLRDLATRPEIYARNIKFYTSGPIEVYELSHPTATDLTRLAREIQGATDPAQAKAGTVRKDLGLDTLARATEEGRALENLIHTSDSKATATYELSVWF